MPEHADHKAKYILVNSISRSGGTFLKSLFDGMEGVLIFPVELSTVRGPVVGFVNQERFRELLTPEAWLEETNLSLYLARFSEKPYRQCFGRQERLDGEPEVFFDLPRFLHQLTREYPRLETVKEAYEWTWRSIFTCIVIDGEPYEHEDGAQAFVNHFPTNVTREFGEFRGEAESVCVPEMLWVVRDPVEHVAGLKRHWSRIAHEPQFWQLALARWEMYVYAALRNRMLYPDSCDLILYSFEPERMRSQFRQSRIDLLRTASTAELCPTVLGIPLRGQSYKEKDGLDLRKPYDYSESFTEEELDSLQTEVRRVYDYLGVDGFDALIEYRRPSAGFQELVEMSAPGFDWMLRRFGEAVDFGASVNLDSAQATREIT